MSSGSRGLAAVGGIGILVFGGFICLCALTNFVGVCIGMSAPKESEARSYAVMCVVILILAILGGIAGAITFAMLKMPMGIGATLQYAS